MKSIKIEDIQNLDFEYWGLSKEDIEITLESSSSHSKIYNIFEGLEEGLTIGSSIPCIILDREYNLLDGMHRTAIAYHFFGIKELPFKFSDEFTEEELKKLGVDF